MIRREKTLSFLQAVCEETGLAPSAVAEKAKVAPSTITRFIAKPEMQSLSPRTLDKIARVVGFDTYEAYISARGLHVVSEIKVEHKGFSSPKAGAWRSEAEAAGGEVTIGKLKIRHGKFFSGVPPQFLNDLCLLRLGSRRLIIGKVSAAREPGFYSIIPISGPEPSVDAEVEQSAIVQSIQRL